ncbi:MAG: hypothetical protein CO138_02320 [Candidatus Moranbacteria bacterium CG_4_9_14_3_um_filter_33_15]|nr:MAG: hypothetical protein CO138_02320 [Candidatus Moranbacteria bacterium CG_4_9_14_3_um_filter_33_15]
MFFSKYLEIFLLILFLTIPFASYAENTSLKNDTSENFLKELPQEMPIFIKEKKILLSKEKMKKWFQEKPQLVYAPEYLSEIEKSDFCSWEKMALCNLLFSYQKQIHIKKESTLNISPQPIQEFVNQLAEEFNQNPESAKFKIENEKVSAFSLGKPGFQLNKEESQKKIIAYIQENDFQKKLELPTTEIEPETANKSIEDLGISQLIGEGKSNFVGSPKNRIYNIKKATEKFEGLLIKPQEEFSFVKILGEVDEENGYLPELVIKKDKTELDFGGGICQVSTTIFRAAINSGLEITARHNHAYPVSYYNPQGMDATVYVPAPDLKFINNTPKYILIQSKIQGTELTFDFYGTTDGRKVNILGPTITEKKSDGSMKTIFTQQVFDENGNLIREAVFKSAYDSPNNYPHPVANSEIFSQKPEGWSDRKWKAYKKEHHL